MEETKIINDIANEEVNGGVITSQHIYKCDTCGHMQHSTKYAGKVTMFCDKCGENRSFTLVQ